LAARDNLLDSASGLAEYHPHSLFRTDRPNSGGGVTGIRRF
jgi:hypothetical protein